MRRLRAFGEAASFDGSGAGKLRFVAGAAIIPATQVAFRALQQLLGLAQDFGRGGHGTCSLRRTDRLPGIAHLLHRRTGATTHDRPGKQCKSQQERQDDARQAEKAL